MNARLFLHIVSLETRKLMSYRAAFWIEAVAAFAAQLGVAYFLWRAVFDATGAERIGGFSRAEMLLYYVLAILLGKLVRGQERLTGLAQDVYDGGLTRYLVYPADYVAFKYAEHLGALAPSAVQLVVLGSCALPFLDLPAAAGIGPASIAMAVGAVAAGNALNFLMLYPIQGVAFWADNVWSLNVMMRMIVGLLGGYMLPLSLFPDWARALLAWSPFPYLYDFPVNVLLGRIGPVAFAQGLGVTLAWSAAFALTGREVWRRGALEYSGVGI